MTLTSVTAGVIVTIGVAWARSMQLRSPESTGQRTRMYAIGEQLGPTFKTEWFGLDGPASEPDSVLMVGTSNPEWGQWYCLLARGAARPMSPHELQPASGIPGWLPIPPDSRGCYEVEAFGWPWPALWDVREPTTPWSTGFGPVESGTMELPGRVAWGGFVANTATGALMPMSGWMLLAGYRRIRLRAGHCGACGYDLRGLPAEMTCPECGGRNRNG